MPSPGCNVDIRQESDPTFFLNPGHTLRTVLKASDRVSVMRHRLQMAHDAGCEVIAVINIGESYRASWYNNDYNAAQWFLANYGDLVDYWQLENEPDNPATALSTPRYNQMFYWWAQFVDNILCPGQGSGTTNWLDDLLQYGDYTQVWRAICYHQYSDNTFELYEQFASYGIPVWITEWGFDTPDDNLQAQLITNRLLEYETLSVERALYFCGGCGVDYFQLVNPDGTPRESYAAYFNGV